MSLDIGETLSKKYGPLPGYAWVGIGGLGVVVIAKMRKSSSTSATPTGDVTLQPASTGALGDMGSGSGGGGGLGYDPSAYSTSPGSGLLPGESAPQPDIWITLPNMPIPDPTADVPQPAPTQPTAPSPTIHYVPSAALVPSNATATSLQATAAAHAPAADAIFQAPTAVDKAALAHPAAVKVTANKTGASANKVQGVFSIH